MRTSPGLSIAALGLAIFNISTLVEAQDYTCTTNNGAITITRYTGSGGFVTIPSTINGLPVTSIGGGAFSWCTIFSVTIPDSVTSIGERVFEGCHTLRGIWVDTLNPTYSSIDGVLFNKSQTTITQCPEGRGWTGGGFGGPFSYTIPSSVTNVGDYAFEYCGVTNIIIPNGLTSIGDGAFFSTGLTSVTIPDSVTSIGDYAFESCGKLTSITVGSNVTSIGDYAFDKCYSLTSVSIPNNVTIIGKGAFYSCGLTSITIGSSVTNIGDVAFAACSPLREITVEHAQPRL